MKINARDWVFEASADPAIATPVWAQVGGLTSFDLNHAEGEESVDTTTFDSAGVAESQAMQRGASLSLEGFAERTGAVDDPGQKVLNDAAKLVGEASLIGVRFRHQDDTSWTVWTSWVSRGSNSGGNNDKTNWSATCTRSGAATTAAVV